MDKSKMGKYSMMRQDKMKNTGEGGGPNASDPGMAARGMMMKQKEASGIGAYNNVIGKYEKNSGIARMMSNLGQTKASVDAEEHSKPSNKDVQRLNAAAAIENAKDNQQKAEQVRRQNSENRRATTAANLENVVVGQKKGKYSTKTDKPKGKPKQRTDYSKKPNTGQKKGKYSTKTDKPKGRAKQKTDYSKKPSKG